MDYETPADCPTYPFTPADVPNLRAWYSAKARFGRAHGWHGEVLFINLAARFLMLRWLYWTVRLRLGMGNLRRMR